MESCFFSKEKELLIIPEVQDANEEQNILKIYDSKNFNLYSTLVYSSIKKGSIHSPIIASTPNSDIIAIADSYIDEGILEVFEL